MQPRVERVRGVTDTLPEEWALLREIEGVFRGWFSSHGYNPIDTPLLEYADIFLRKSGGEMAASIYTFTDNGGHRVSLRPEFTASVIRLLLERGQALPLPVRWQYCGPVFRYERPQRSRYRQFTQQGVELIGAREGQADAEILALAYHGLVEVGLNRFQLYLGHVGVILQLLAGFNLSERAKQILVANLGELRQGGRGKAYVWDRIAELGLVPETPSGAARTLHNIDEGTARELVEGMLAGLDMVPTGVRQVEDIVGRFLHRLKGADDLNQLQRALDFVSELAAIQGPPEPALRAATALIQSYNLDPSALGAVRHLLELLEQHELLADGQRSVVLDLGLARGLAYYTGMIFEVYYDHPAGDRQLCGGGRYDGLVRSLGGHRDSPALGFAFGLERIRDALVLQGNTSDRGICRPASALIMTTDQSGYGQAVSLARSLRAQGQWVEVDVLGRSLRANLQYARKHKIGTVIVVNAEGQRTEHSIPPTAGEEARGHITSSPA